MNRRGQGTVERLARLLLWLYPPAFRRECSAEILQFVRTAAADANGSHLAWLVVADAFRSLVREWRTALVRPQRHAGCNAYPRGELMRNLVRDFALSGRLLIKSPGFTLAAVLTLALGIGANTAMFTLADATLLRPLSVRAPENLVVWSWSGSYPDYKDYATRTDLFDGVLAVAGTTRVNLEVNGVTNPASASFMSGNGFDVLGASARHGRTLLPSDDVPNAPIVAVLSHHFWRARFAGDPSVIGRVFRVNSHVLTIIGVAEKSFRGTSLRSVPDLYVPTAASPTLGDGVFAGVDPLTARDFTWLTIIGRLKPSVPLSQATASVDTMYAQLRPPRQARERQVMHLEPLQSRALGGGASAVRTFVGLLVGVVGLTLLIGCANLANLLLAKAAARRREIGVRMALGATRRRVVQQMLTESLVLAGIGGLAGIAIAALSLEALARFQLPGNLPIANLALSMDRAALAATFGLSLVTGVLFGVLPAWRASRTDVLVSLRGASRSTTSRGGARSLLLGAQVAMSLVLLTGAGLFARSLAAALDRPLGFEVRDVMTATVDLRLAQFDKERAARFYQDALERVRSVPHGRAVAWSTMVPTRGLRMSDATVEGYTMAAGEDLSVSLSHVSREYFETVGTRMLRGSTFDPDSTGPVVPGIISESMAKKYWQGRDPIGGVLKIGTSSITVIGVVEDTIVRTLEESKTPQLYLSLDRSVQARSTRIITDPIHLFVRTGGDVAAAVPIIREQLRALEPKLPLYDMDLFEKHVQMLVMPQRMGALLLSFFSALALALATVGIYGVASYGAALRTREIGVRMALGATARSVQRMMLAQGAGPVAIGILVGLALALYSSRLARAFLVDVSPFDPLTFASATAVLVTVALVASYLPARRASRVAPVTALRDD